MRSKLAQLVLLPLLAGACGAAPEPLSVDERSVTVRNDTGEAWTDVEIWVNDHYRVTRAAIASGERFVAPLETFVAGFGQRFPPTQRVSGVELTATDASGDRVRLVWGDRRGQ